VICPKCGEDNSDNFRFCGMCGTLLEPRPEARPEARTDARTEARRPAGAPVPNPRSAVPPPLPTKIANAPEPLRTPLAENATTPANKPVPPISGPSMLGLSQPGANQTGANQPSPHQPSPHQPSLHQPSLHQPSLDSLREKSFSGLDSFFEPEQPKTGRLRILLLVALLAALGVAGWWTYTNYLGAMESRKPEAATSNATGKPSTKAVAQNAAPAPTAGSPQAVVPSAGVPESQAGNASAVSEPARKTVDAAAKPEAKPVTPKLTPKLTPRIALGDKSAEKREPRATSPNALKLPAPAAGESGDAAFRKGEAYLYGRGVPENCAEAVKNLKAASAKSSAKARSAFGTMYATGHCVPRDLPTSYLWFALALRVDPNNQILEKDLSAIWNQMTPPERQMATRMKQ
jgi:hypothetical protein